MKERRRTGVIQTIGAFTLGAAIGSLSTLLFAPASGRATRKRIGQEFQALQRKAGRQLGQAKRLLARKADDLREVATEKLNHARRWMVGHVANGHPRTAKRPARRRVLQHA